jgi:hypothetical protein
MNEVLMLLTQLIHMTHEQYLHSQRWSAMTTRSLHDRASLMESLLKPRVVMDGSQKEIAASDDSNFRLDQGTSQTRGGWKKCQSPV